MDDCNHSCLHRGGIADKPIGVAHDSAELTAPD